MTRGGEGGLDMGVLEFKKKKKKSLCSIITASFQVIVVFT